MTRYAARDEFVRHWLPHVTDAGLLHLISLLEQASPLLIHGQFLATFPQGCLASQIAWHHPRTASLEPEDAGVVWLTKVAGLNPATSILLTWWDQKGLADRELCHLLLEACYQECARRQLVPAGSRKMASNSEDCSSSVAPVSGTDSASTCDSVPRNNSFQD